METGEDREGPGHLLCSWGGQEPGRAAGWLRAVGSRSAEAAQDMQTLGKREEIQWGNSTCAEPVGDGTGQRGAAPAPSPLCLSMRPAWLQHV